MNDNHLTGSIPSEIGNLSTLWILNLSSNRLSGKVPAGITNLQGLYLSTTDIGYNALWTDDPTVQAFLDSKDPGWDDTQTIAPEGVTVASVGDRTVWLEWTPIPYTSDSGGYELYSNELPGGTQAFAGATPDKYVTTFPVTDLQPSATYDLTIATTTYPHANNSHTVISDPSVPVMVTTGDSGCLAPVVVFDHHQTAFTLEVQTTHDAFEWVTGETTQSITVSPTTNRWYWVKTFGPGACAEAGVVFVTTRLFGDGRAWSEVFPPRGTPPIETGMVSYCAFDDGAGSVAADSSYQLLACYDSNPLYGDAPRAILKAADPVPDPVSARFVRAGES